MGESTESEAPENSKLEPGRSTQSQWAVRPWAKKQLRADWIVFMCLCFLGFSQLGGFGVVGLFTGQLLTLKFSESKRSMTLKEAFQRSHCVPSARM